MGFTSVDHGARRARPRLRVLPRQVRQRRGQARRRVLHPAQRGQAAGRDAGAVPRAGCTTRAAGPAACSCSPRSSSRRTAAGGKTGDIAVYGQEVQRHHLAAGEDEPRHPRHRRATSASAGPTPSADDQSSRPAGRLHPGQPAVQHVATGARTLRDDPRWQLRRAAAGQRQLRLAPAHRPPPRRPTAVAGVVLANGSMSSKQSGEGEIRRRWSRRTWWTCMVALPGAPVPHHRRSRPACGS